MFNKQRSQLSGIWVRTKMRPLSKQSKNNPDELMGHSQDSLLVGGPLFPFTQEIGPEEMVNPGHTLGHEKDDPSCVPVSPFGNFALPFKLSRLINGGVQPGVSDELPVIPKPPHIPHLCQEVKGCDIPYPLDGLEDFQVLPSYLAAHPGEHLLDLRQFLLEEEQVGDFLGEDELPGRAGGGYGDPGQGEEFLRGDSGLSSLSLILQDLSQPHRVSSFNGPGRGVELEKVEEGRGKDVQIAGKFRKGDLQEPLDIVFQPGDLQGDAFPLSGQITEIAGEKGALRKRGMKLGQELGNGQGIPSIGLGLPQGELEEMGDKQRIEDHNPVSLGYQEGKEVDMVTSGGLLPNEQGFLGEIPEALFQLLKTLPVHGEDKLKEFLLPLVESAGHKGFLSDINAHKHLIHERTSCNIFPAMAGGASRPILQGHKGLKAQPTYHGSGRQGTHSFEGSRAQVKESPPALPLLFSMGYSHLHIVCSTNS